MRGLHKHGELRAECCLPRMRACSLASPEQVLWPRRRRCLPAGLIGRPLNPSVLLQRSILPVSEPASGPRPRVAPAPRPHSSSAAHQSRSRVCDEALTSVGVEGRVLGRERDRRRGDGRRDAFGDIWRVCQTRGRASALPRSGSSASAQSRDRLRPIRVARVSC